MSWNDERIQQLRDLWSQGYSASEIAAKLGGITRNAVIGKVHRLGLSGRPSPIRRGKSGGSKASNTPRTQTAKSPNPQKILPRIIVRDTQEEMGAAVIALPSPPPEKLEALKARAARLPERQCRWPMGDPRKPDFHFCKDPAYDEMPYCWMHSCMAYQGFAKRSLRALHLQDTGSDE